MVRYMFNEYFVFPLPISKMHPSMSTLLGLKNSHFDLKSTLIHSDIQPCIFLGEATRCLLVENETSFHQTFKYYCRLSCPDWVLKKIGIAYFILYVKILSKWFWSFIYHNKPLFNFPRFREDFKKLFSVLILQLW